MYNNIDDDEEMLQQQDDGIPVIRAGEPLPNTPRNPDDPREMLRRELERKYGNERTMMSPQMRAENRGARDTLLENNRDIAMQKLLANSAAQIGTIGGKAASTAGFDNFTRDLRDQNESAYKGMMQDRSDMQNAEDRRLKIMEYLSDRYGKDRLADAQMDNRKAQMEYRKDRDEAQDKYRNKMVEATRGNRNIAQANNQRDFEFKLINDYENDKTTGNTGIIREQVSRARKVAANPSPANDMSLVYALMKANDPPSTIRESEFQMGTNLGGIDQKILNLRQRIIDGKMDDTTRQGILQSIETLANAQEQAQSDVDRVFEEKARHWNIDPNVILGSRRSRYKPETKPETPSKPAASSAKTKPVTPGKIRVSNGSETLDIDPADLEEARRENFEVVQ